MDIEFFYRPRYNGSKKISPYHIHSSNITGFGSVADDYSEQGIVLKEQLIKNKSATFFWSMNSHAMIGAVIHSGDVLIVDSSVTYLWESNRCYYERKIVPKASSKEFLLASTGRRKQKIRHTTT